MKKSLKLFAIFTLIATFVAGLIAPFTAKAAEKAVHRAFFLMKTPPEGGVCGSSRVSAQRPAVGDAPQGGAARRPGEEAPQGDGEQRSRQDDQVRAAQDDREERQEEAPDDGPDVKGGDAPRARGRGHGRPLDGAHGRAPGTGVPDRTSRTTSAPVTEVIHSSGLMEMRCARAGTATALTSSGAM